MKAAVIRYLNEIVSLTVLALMAVALIAGQAEATAHGAADDIEPTVLRAEFAIEVDLRDLGRLHINKESVEAIRNVIETRLEGRD